jgi:hypothetical protein
MYIYNYISMWGLGHVSKYAVDGIVKDNIFWLVVWNIFILPYIGNVIIPTDEHIFVSEGWLNHQPAWRIESRWILYQAAGDHPTVRMLQKIFRMEARELWSEYPNQMIDYNWLLVSNFFSCSIIYGIILPID